MSVLSAVRPRSGPHHDHPDSTSYDETLRMLSEASVDRHFEPYVDIEWDSPEFEVTDGDRRWILSASTDPLGRHPWYQALPEHQQIADRHVAPGQRRQGGPAVRAAADQRRDQSRIRPAERFRRVPVLHPRGHRGVQPHPDVPGDGEPRRPDVPGGGRMFKALMPFLGLAGRFLPEVFFTGILAGEEPIDHLQKSILRSGEDIHPIMQGVMRIHVAEEARHISFAHKFLAHRVPQLSRPGRFVLSIAFPITMRVLCDVIVIPPKEFWDEFDIPGVGQARPVLGPARVAAGTARLLRRCARARRADRPDEPRVATGVAAVRHRRRAHALPQRAGPRARRRRRQRRLRLRAAPCPTW